MYFFILVFYPSMLWYISIKNLLLLKLTKLQSFLLLGIIYVSMLTHTFLENYTIILIFLSVFIYICTLTKNRLQNLIMLTIAYIICVICENGLYCILYYAFDLDILYVRVNNKFYYFLYAVIVSGFVFIVSYGVKRLIQHKILKGNVLSAIKETQVLILSNLILCTIIYAFNVIADESVGYTPSIITFNLIIFAIYFMLSTVIIIVVIKAYIEKNNLKIKQYSFSQLQDYTKKIEAMYSELRAFKHDYINIMASMSGYIENNDMEGLEKYFSSKIMPIRNQIIQSNFKINQLMNINIIEIKSLLSSKLIYANEIGIDVTVDIMDQINEISIDIIDLSRVLGIFIDNAVEAALETPEPQMTVCIIKNNNSVAVIVTNTFIDKDIPIYKLGNLSFSSKGENRGTGLYNVKNIINNYDNVMKETYIKDNIFVQHLEITDN